MYLNNPGMLSSGCRHSMRSHNLAKQPSTVNFLASGIEYKALLFMTFSTKTNNQTGVWGGGGGDQEVGKAYKAILWSDFKFFRGNL